MPGSDGCTTSFSASFHSNPVILGLVSALIDASHRNGARPEPSVTDSNEFSVYIVKPIKIRGAILSIKKKKL